MLRRACQWPVISDQIRLETCGRVFGGRRKMEGLFGKEGLRYLVEEMNARVFNA